MCSCKYFAVYAQRMVVAAMEQRRRELDSMTPPPPTPTAALPLLLDVLIHPKTTPSQKWKIR